MDVKFMSKLLLNLVSGAMKFFSIENESFDILNSTELLRRRNIIVNRLLLVTNILITIFIALYKNIEPADSISLLLPSIGINVLITYFVFTQKDDYEKQILGMYVAVLSVSYIALRLFYLYPQPYTYVFIYIALVIIALFQNRHAIILGDVLIFFVATFIHLNEMFKIRLGAQEDDSPVLSIISNKENASYDVFVYTMFLLLFIVIITSMVFFSEYLDKERKNELKKREELENEFENVVWNVFDTIEDFSQVTDEEELTSDYVSALMTRKLGQFLKFDDKRCEDLFNFAIVLGVNTDFNVSYSVDEKKDLLKDYSKMRRKLGIGSLLLKRTRIRVKCEGMVRSRYESWLLSENFKKIKAEDSSIDNQLVLLSETYITLRDKQSYKKALPHAKAMKELSETFSHFFDSSTLNIFLENHAEFEAIYERTRC